MDEVIAQLKKELSDRMLEIKHLNAVNQELQDELTAAKLELIQLKEAAEEAYYREVRAISEGME